MWDQLGTPSYMAPELWSSEPEYDSSVDMWAIGVVTYMLLSGKRPFHHDNKREKARMIRHDPLKFPDQEWGHVSEEAKDFCRALMQKAPRERLSATAAKDHPWIKHSSTLHQGKDIAVEMQRHAEIVDSLQVSRPGSYTDRQRGSLALSDRHAVTGGMEAVGLVLADWPPSFHPLPTH